MKDESEARETVGVTPPGGDIPSMRAWLVSKAEDGGFTDLEWEAVPDRYGGTFSRLTGVRRGMKLSEP